MSFDEPEMLQHIFKLQRNMQVKNSKKRSKIYSPDGQDKDKQLDMAMYLWNAATIEFGEFIEVWDEYSSNFEDKELYDASAEELIDILHFIVSMLIYSGVDIDKLPSMKSLYPEYKKLDLSEPNKKLELREISECWFDISIFWGAFLEQLPYKKWKTYENPEYVGDMYSASGLLKHFFKLCYTIKLTPVQVYEKYLEKNQINKDRQEKGGRYEK